VNLFAVKYFQKRFGLRKYQIPTDLNWIIIILLKIKYVPYFLRLLEIKTQKPPVLGMHGSQSAWIQIPNIPNNDYHGTKRWLSVSPHATLEIKQDTGEVHFLVFPIARYITTTKTEDASRNTVWITIYNDKDPKKDSEHPEINPNENLR